MTSIIEFLVFLGFSILVLLIILYIKSLKVNRDIKKTISPKYLEKESKAPITF
jgi:hypothetical protein